MKYVFRLVVAALFVASGAMAAGAATPKRVQITGEVIDTWCYITEIMYGEGTAHHQCALWCAAGETNAKASAATPIMYRMSLTPRTAECRFRRGSG